MVPSSFVVTVPPTSLVPSLPSSPCLNPSWLSSLLLLGTPSLLASLPESFPLPRLEGSLEGQAQVGRRWMWEGGTGGEKVEMGRGHRWGGSTGGEKVDVGRGHRWGEGRYGEGA